MKATLIKRENHYDLFEETRFISTTECEDGTVNKLSKQNCDEIFGVLNAEKLAEEYDPNYAITDISNGFHFIEGFNKAMELNKDKEFTLEDIRIAIVYGEKHRDMDAGKIPYQPFFEFLSSLQKPTEIEVEIEMEDVIQLKKRAGGITNMGKPKLDSDGCLILKKL